MSYNSILDNYYDYIQRDSDYYRKWLKLYGTECDWKTPRVDSIDRINDIYTAYGANTYASTSINYDTQKIDLVISPIDFTKIENGIETSLMVVSPEKLDDGDLIEFKRKHKWYTFEVSSPIESYWEMLYRVPLKLNRVREVDV